MKTILRVILLGSFFLAGCQFPLTPKSQGFQLTLNFSSPSLRSVEPSSRVLLPTASQVTLTVTSGGKPVDTKTVSTNGTNSVTFTLNLPPLATYDLKAEARDTAGKLVFAGSTSVQLLGALSGTLNLFPVDASGSMAGWTAVTAAPANQPVGGSVAQSLTLSAGESQSFRLDWSNASSFTFQTAAGLELYLQTATGSPVTIPTDTKTVTSDSSPAGAWITYYAPSAPVSLATLGRFSIPAQSVTTDDSVNLNKGETKLLSFVVTPANADNQSLSDFTWSALDTNVASVDAFGLVTAEGPGKTTITVTSKLLPAVSDSLEIEVTLPSFQGIFELQTPTGSTWSKEASAPVGTIALAGNATLLYALTDTQNLVQYLTGIWKPVMTLPAGLVHLAVAPDGTLFAADADSVYQFTGTWEKLPGTVSGLSGLAAAGDGQLYVSNASQLLVRSQGVWAALGNLPAGYQSLGGGDGVYASTGVTSTTAGTRLRWDAARWVADGSLPAGTLAFTAWGGTVKALKAY